MSVLSSVIAEGVFASRPAFGIPGRLYFSTDTQALYYDTGSAWLLMVLSPAQYVFGSLPGTPIAGQMAVVTDSTVNTWGATITVGGGTDQVLAWFNGTNWTVTGK